MRPEGDILDVLHQLDEDREVDVAEDSKTFLEDFLDKIKINYLNKTQVNTRT